MKILRVTTVFFILLFLGFQGCSRPVANLDSRGRTIICFGDSITEGVGAVAGDDYPSVLSRNVSLPVINAGVGGDTTADALKRIDEDVFAHDPRMVIIMLGGNDFLRKLPKAQTFANMEEIVFRIRKHGAVAVVAVVKIGLWGDSYTKEFKKIANDHGALFIPDIMKGVLSNPKLKYDRIHPNAAGYRIIAERISKAIAPLLEQMDRAR